MKLSSIILSFVIGFASSYTLFSYLSNNHLNLKSAYFIKSGTVSPDSLITNLLSSLEQYKEERHIPFQRNFEVTHKIGSGVIETTWYKEHKGEVSLKIQIIHSGTNYRVEVWQQTGILNYEVVKTEWARRTEEVIESIVSTKLKEYNKTLKQTD